jgi:hypothetical protein
MGHIVTQLGLWIQLSHENSVVFMETKLNRHVSALRSKVCIHLRSLNIRHFGTVETMRLKSMASRSLSVA